MDNTERNKEMDVIKRILSPKETVVSLPPMYGIEYLLLKDGVPHKWLTYTRAEGKKEGDKRAYYSCAKIMSGLELFRTTGNPFEVMAAWDDAICASRVHNTDSMILEYSVLNEPVYCVPHQHFAVRHTRKI